MAPNGSADTFRTVSSGQRMTEVEREFREIRLPLAHRYGVDNGLNRVVVDPPDAWIGLVATGFTYLELVDALRRLGLEDDPAIAAAGIRVLQLRMPVPFDRDLVRRFARGLDEIVVVEEKNPTLEWLVKDALYGGADQPRVVGKSHPDGRTLMRSYGRLDADAILPGLRERLAIRLDHRLLPIERPRQKTLIPLSAARTPYFCSGCPHNWGTQVPEGALVGAGTGCHGMTLLMDNERVGEGIGITAMGNEGAQWVGMEPFVEADHLFQNYGDGTYFHSGQLAIQYCIGAGKNVTFKILYNSTVAMTGGQDSVAPVAVPQLVEILLAQGVKRVAITADDPSRYDSIALPKGVAVRDRTEITTTQDELRSISGVTVLIHDQECAAELRRGRRRGTVATPTRRVVINHRICEGCGDCGDISNCLSVQPVDTPLGRKTTIDQHSCNFDFSCLEGDCPAFMTVELDPKKRTSRPDPAAMPSEPLPDPVYTGPADRSLVRMAGIGGTGVVTVAQIVGTAAMFDGWSVHGLDQTGLSQKAGPVVSDVVLTRPSAHSSNLVGDAQADLILGFDGLVASSDRVIRTADPDATIAIVSTHRTPTGHMVTHPDTAYPTTQIRTRIDDACDAGRNRFVDAAGLTETLVGSAAPTNVFLLGVAVQAGTLPLSVENVSRAIDLNGIAVPANQAAFEWGRRWAHDPSAVEAKAEVMRNLAVSDPTSVVTVTELPRKLSSRVDQFPESIRGVVAMLAADLVGYQDQAYATRFLRTVEQAFNGERQSGSSLAYTEAVARSLHKLMAYKDEYEVARLMLLPEAGETIAQVGGPDATFAWQLHPPMLSALGVSSKIGFDQRSKPAFKALAAGKRFRGTKLDPFGRTHMRRTERELVTEFEDVIATVTRALSKQNLDAAIAIAELPDQVRGFEDLKLRRIGEYRQQLHSAIESFAAHDRGSVTR